MQQDLKDLIEQLKALSPEEARAACWDLVYRLRDATDPEEVRAIYEGMARFDPGIAAATLCSRRCRQGFESGRAYARGLSVAQARQVIDQLAWSFGDSSPEADALTEQGVPAGRPARPVGLTGELGRAQGPEPVGLPAAPAQSLEQPCRLAPPRARGGKQNRIRLPSRGPPGFLSSYPITGKRGSRIGHRANGSSLLPTDPFSREE